jgi:hypothetical protein
MPLRWAVPLAIAAVLAVTSCAQQAAAGPGGDQPDPGPAVPFGTFLASLGSQTYRDYAGRPGTRVLSQQAFDEMRSYLLAYYHGARAVQTHVLSGAVIDCLARGGTPANPPAPAAAPTGSPATAAQPAICPPGSIPVRRLTLGQLVRFPTLQHYLAKSPGGSGQLPPAGQHS